MLENANMYILESFVCLFLSAHLIAVSIFAPGNISVLISRYAVGFLISLCFVILHVFF